MAKEVALRRPTLSFLAERRAGEFLRDMPKGGPSTNRNSLLQLGIGHMESSRWQRLATAKGRPGVERPTNREFDWGESPYCGLYQSGTRKSWQGGKIYHRTRKGRGRAARHQAPQVRGGYPALLAA